MIKYMLKKIVPQRVQHKMRVFQYRVFGLENPYKHLSTEKVFDTIYQNGIWGTDDKGLSTSGIGSHDDNMVSTYVSAVKKLFEDYSLKTAVDLGCGDFYVGSKLCDLFERYTACDISSTILNQNSKKYRKENLLFKKLNLANDELPVGDVAFVRQVLQHLSNREIDCFVKKLNDTKPYKYVVVTEHLPASENFVPNIDKPSGPNIRVSLESGVILHASPFQMDYKEQHEICCVHDSSGGVKSVIRSTLYVL